MSTPVSFTNGIFIEDDNLNALRYLQSDYLNKIKMIYIDPPYNTGKDRLYKDRFDNWSDMMQPRLELAKTLLRDDGVIFISIDDSSLCTVISLCNKIFGSKNFIANLIRKKRNNCGMTKSNISVDHEYIVTYSKTNHISFKGYEKSFDKYKNPDNDPRGPWIHADTTLGMTYSENQNHFYDLVDPATGDIYPGNPNRLWRYVPASMSKKIKEGRIVFRKSKMPFLKQFKNEVKRKYYAFSSLLPTSFGLNYEGTHDFKKLMGNRVFDFPKPVKLVKSLINQTCSDNDIVLDFFAGSCTTAQSVIEYNFENHKSIKYIVVQIPEPCKKNSLAYEEGYKTIADIGKERIKRAEEKYEHTGVEQRNIFHDL